MEYSQALKLAEEIKAQLLPHCLRVEIAGSIRRKKPKVKDIEIVLIPNPYQVGLFEDGIAAVINKWPKLKGELQYGKCRYTQREYKEMKVDIFIADPTNFGLILAIRTGNAEFSQKILMATINRKGYKCQDGHLYHGKRVHDVREEEDLFKRLNIPYVKPEKRNL